MVLAAALAVASTSAWSQSPLNDPRRQAYVVPFARSATDCLAREFLRDPAAAEIVRSGRVRNALARPFRACADEIEALITAHDRAYYPGAGEAFFRGPYLAGLPGAIARRVQSEIDRREQEEAARLASEAAQEAERQRASEAAAAAAREEAARRNSLRQQAAQQEDDRRRQAEVDLSKVEDIRRETPSAQARSITPFANTSNPAPRPAASAPASSADTGGSAPMGVIYGIGALALLGALKLWRERVRERRLLEGRQARIAELLAKFGDQGIVDRIMASEVWLGMTRDMLIESRGWPEDTDTEITTRKRKEVFKYDQFGRNRFRRRITLEDGVVVGSSELGS